MKNDEVMKVLAKLLKELVCNECNNDNLPMDKCSDEEIPKRCWSKELTKAHTAIIDAVIKGLRETLLETKVNYIDTCMIIKHFNDKLKPLITLKTKDGAE